MCRNSVTTGPIHYKSSSSELFWPVDVQHYGHLPIVMGVPMGVIRASGTSRTPVPSNHWSDSFQIKFIGTVLGCRCATLWSFAHGTIMGVPMGVKRAPRVLRVQGLSNHLADSLQIKSIGNVLACRCASSWSFAH